MVYILIEFPEYANRCIKSIINSGFEAYFVGGCVRDSILKREYEDIDIATSALPDDIVTIFEYTVPTGIKHGTVTVIIDGHKIEVTTFRQEFGYDDSRHPNKVSFVSSLEKDLSRRDFTINAFACTYDGKIIDIFGGQNDLENRLIKAVGAPEIRFDEDALRIVRAFRFSSALDFDFDGNTKKAALALSHKLSHVSGERLFSELKKCACGKRPAAITELISTGALSCFGIYYPLFTDDAFNRIASLDLDVSAKLSLLISLCKHDLLLLKTKLKVDNNTIKNITVLDELSAIEIPTNKQQIKRLLYKYNPQTVSLYFHYLMLINAVCDGRLFSIIDEIKNGKEAFNISHLRINGDDLLTLGYSGAEIKNTLENALFSVIDGAIENTRDSLLNFLKN